MTVGSTAPLAGQLQAMIGFTSACDPAALHQAWSTIRSQSLTPSHLSEIEPDPLRQEDGFVELDRFKRRIVDEVRPVLDRRLQLFMDENRPLTLTALTRQGFESVEDAILLADRARDLAVLSDNPSEALITSALTLVLPSVGEREPIPAAGSKRLSGVQLSDQDEKMFLITSAKRGDIRALDKLLFLYQPLIFRVARIVSARFELSAADADELLQRGRIECAALVKRFDPENGAAFETYAWRCIYLHLIKCAVKELSAIYRPERHRAQLRRIDAARWELHSKFGFQPHDDEVARALGIGVRQLREEQIQRFDEVSLSTPIGLDEDFDYERMIAGCDAIRPDHVMLKLNLREKLDRAIAGSGLTEQEIAALRFCYLEGYAVQETGTALGLSNGKVLQMLSSARRKIAGGPFADELKELQA